MGAKFGLVVLAVLVLAGLFCMITSNLNDSSGSSQNPSFPPPYVPATSIPLNPTQPSLTVTAPGEKIEALNSDFLRFQEYPNLIHLWSLDDDGRPGNFQAIIYADQAVTFGFEWFRESLTGLVAAVTNNPSHAITVSVDGGPDVSVKNYYQEAFSAAPGNGIPASWDHDGDGMGDPDGDGVDDWNGPTIFFRYQVAGLTVGPHTFKFSMYNPDTNQIQSETIQILVIPK